MLLLAQFPKTKIKRDIHISPEKLELEKSTPMPFERYFRSPFHRVFVYFLCLGLFVRIFLWPLFLPDLKVRTRIAQESVDVHDIVGDRVEAPETFNFVEEETVDDKPIDDSFALKAEEEETIEEDVEQKASKEDETELEDTQIKVKSKSDFLKNLCEDDLKKEKKAKEYFNPKLISVAMDGDAKRIEFYKYIMSPIQTGCRMMKRIGNDRLLITPYDNVIIAYRCEGADEWRRNRAWGGYQQVCLDDFDFDECLVYSFGIEKDFIFEDAIAKMGSNFPCSESVFYNQMNNY